MFTRNYWKTTAAERLGASKEILGTSDAISKPKLITVSGDVGADHYSSQPYTQVPFNINSSTFKTNVLKYVSTVDVCTNITDTSQSNRVGSYPRVFFGTGNTPESLDDYTFAGDVVQNITYSSVDNSNYDEDGSGATHSFTYTITNNNDYEITIGEIGIFSEAVWMTAYNKYTHYGYMFERTALETPITITPGGVGQVEYTIRMNYPVPTATE